MHIRVVVHFIIVVHFWNELKMCRFNIIKRIILRIQQTNIFYRFNFFVTECVDFSRVHNVYHILSYVLKLWCTGSTLRINSRAFNKRPVDIITIEFIVFLHSFFFFFFTLSPTYENVVQSINRRWNNWKPECYTAIGYLYRIRMEG